MPKCFCSMTSPPKPRKKPFIAGVVWQLASPDEGTHVPKAFVVEKAFSMPDPFEPTWAVPKPAFRSKVLWAYPSGMLDSTSNDAQQPRESFIFVISFSE